MSCSAEEPSHLSWQDQMTRLSSGKTVTSEQLPRKVSEERDHRSSAAPRSVIRGGTSRILKKDITLRIATFQPNLVKV